MLARSFVCAAALSLASATALPAQAQDHVPSGRPAPAETTRAAPFDIAPEPGAAGLPGASADRSATRALGLDPEAAARSWTLIGRGRDGGEVRLEPGERVIRAAEDEEHGSLDPQPGGDDTPPAQDESSRAVIGTDGRGRVADTTSFPFSTVGYLQMRNAAGDVGFCTAAVVGPRMALTAAQCLYNHAEQGGWLRDFAFWPGLNGEDDRPFGAVAFKTVYVFDGFVTAFDGSYDSVWSYDVGLVEFDEAIGIERTGWLGFRSAGNDGDFDGRMIAYHGDKEMFTQWQAECSVPVEDVGPRDFLHSCDTGNGATGAPIFVLDRANGDLQIVGLHIGPEGDANWALRLHRPVFEWMRELYER